MSLIIIAVVGPATAGLLVLGALAVRLWRDVNRLAREVDGAARAMAEAAGDLERAAAPLGDVIDAWSGGQPVPRA